MLCGACGQQLSTDSAFCHRCGAQISTTGVALPTRPAPSKTVAGGTGQAIGRRRGLSGWKVSLGVIALSGVVLWLTYAKNGNQVHSKAQASATPENISTSATPYNPGASEQRAGALLAAQQAENAFLHMTPQQHLAIARRELRANSGETEIDDAMKNLQALKGTPLERQGKALQSRYEVQKERTERAAAIEQMKVDVQKEKAEQKAEAVYLEKARVGYAQKIQGSLYDQDMDADVKAIGPHHTTLRVTWALATKMFVYKVNHNEALQGDLDDMRQIGFKKFVLTDGYDHLWVWTLDK